MHLYLIRHGETVDNVAGLFAGVRDSELTNHGFQQAKRLGQYFNTKGVRITHLFSSDLQRAFKTAEAIRETQLIVDGLLSSQLTTRTLKILREKDFGSMEGKAWSSKGKELTHLVADNGSTFRESETKESMIQRMDSFLDEHLLVLATADTAIEPIVAVVSHGIILSVLWRRLLQRLPKSQASLSLEHVSWSNTGYISIVMRETTAPKVVGAATVGPASKSDLDQKVDQSPGLDDVAKGLTEVSSNELGILSSSLDGATEVPATSVGSHPMSKAAQSIPPSPVILKNWTATVQAINSKEHLLGLKRTGGGVGSSKLDQKQTSIDSFFKRQKRA